jgi:hypothetical protein
VAADTGKHRGKNFLGERMFLGCAEAQSAAINTSAGTEPSVALTVQIFYKAAIRSKSKQFQSTVRKPCARRPCHRLPASS